MDCLIKWFPGALGGFPERSGCGGAIEKLESVVCFDEGTCYSPQSGMLACLLLTAQGEELASFGRKCLLVSLLRLQISRERMLQEGKT